MQQDAVSDVHSHEYVTMTHLQCIGEACPLDLLPSLLAHLFGQLSEIMIYEVVLSTNAWLACGHEDACQLKHNAHVHIRQDGFLLHAMASCFVSVIHHADM